MRRLNQFLSKNYLYPPLCPLRSFPAVMASESMQTVELDNDFAQARASLNAAAQTHKAAFERWELLMKTKVVAQSLPPTQSLPPVQLEVC